MFFPFDTKPGASCMSHLLGAQSRPQRTRAGVHWTGETPSLGKEQALPQAGSGKGGQAGPSVTLREDHSHQPKVTQDAPRGIYKQPSQNADTSDLKNELLGVLRCSDFHLQ